MFFDTTLQSRLQAHLSAPGAVAEFWAPLGHAVWFGKDPVFDQTFRAAFAVEHGAAARGELMPWLATPAGALSLAVLLDQYPRNAFRRTPRMYATDTLARVVADAALELGHDERFVGLVIAGSMLAVFAMLMFLCLVLVDMLRVRRPSCERTAFSG